MMKNQVVSRLTQGGVEMQGTVIANPEALHIHCCAGRGGGIVGSGLTDLERAGSYEGAADK